MWCGGVSLPDVIRRSQPRAADAARSEPSAGANVPQAASAGTPATAFVANAASAPEMPAAQVAHPLLCPPSRSDAQAPERSQKADGKMVDRWEEQDRAAFAARYASDKQFRDMVDARRLASQKQDELKDAYERISSRLGIMQLEMELNGRQVPEEIETFNRVDRQLGRMQARTEPRFLENETWIAWAKRTLAECEESLAVAPILDAMLDVTLLPHERLRQALLLMVVISYDGTMLVLSNSSFVNVVKFVREAGSGGSARQVTTIDAWERHLMTQAIAFDGTFTPFMPLVTGGDGSSSLRQSLLVLLAHGEMYLVPRMLAVKENVLQRSPMAWAWVHMVAQLAAYQKLHGVRRQIVELTMRHVELAHQASQDALGEKDSEILAKLAQRIEILSNPLLDIDQQELLDRATSLDDYVTLRRRMLREKNGTGSHGGAPGAASGTPPAAPDPSDAGAGGVESSAAESAAALEAGAAAALDAGASEALDVPQQTTPLARAHLLRGCF